MSLVHNTIASAAEMMDQGFTDAGGKVYKTSADGLPLWWRCGRDESGDRVNPPGVTGELVTYKLNHDGAWEGCVPWPEKPKRPDFKATGGYILEYDANGQPVRWVCGMDHGHQVNPPEFAHQPVTYVNKGQGKYEGHPATPQDEDDRIDWDDAAAQ